MLFIAEIGLNHNGNPALCYELIRQAKASGADVAKFQCGWRQGKDEINHQSAESMRKLRKWCDYFDIEFMTSVFTPESYELAKAASPDRYKIASRTVKDDLALVEKVVAESKHTFVSLGMWDDLSSPPKLDESKVSFLWCRSCYPTEPEEMLDFPKDFSQTYFAGYSDHTIGIETALLAVARGATVIEKHFTLDKSDTTIRDHALSATPDEFAQLVAIGRDIAKKIKVGV